MHDQDFQGIIATLPELIRARPAKAVTGFAPSGRVSTQLWGTNRSVFQGRGMEFSESRAYQPGDDVRAIDWRVTARTGMTHTKLFQEERERPVHILLDLRAMMQFGSRVRFKSHLAAEIAAMLGWVGLDGGDRVGGMILTRSRLRDFRAARTRRALLGFLDAIMQETLPETAPASETPRSEPSLAEGLRRLRRTARPGALVFVISDFNDLDAQGERELRRLATHTQVTILQVTDPLDAALPSNAGRISDGIHTVALGAVRARDLKRYAADFADRQARLERLSRQHNMAFRALSTSDPATDVLTPPQKAQVHKQPDHKRPDHKRTAA